MATQFGMRRGQLIQCFTGGSRFDLELSLPGGKLAQWRGYGDCYCHDCASLETNSFCPLFFRGRVRVHSLLIVDCRFVIEPTSELLAVSASRKQSAIGNQKSAMLISSSL